MYCALLGVSMKVRVRLRLRLVAEGKSAGSAP